MADRLQSVNFRFSKDVTSSPCYTQSKGVTENAVKQAKNCLKSARMMIRYGVGFLNLHNTPWEDSQEQEFVLTFFYYIKLIIIQI